MLDSIQLPGFFLLLVVPLSLAMCSGNKSCWKLLKNYIRWWLNLCAFVSVSVLSAYELTRIDGQQQKKNRIRDRPKRFSLLFFYWCIPILMAFKNHLSNGSLVIYECNVCVLKNLRANRFSHLDIIWYNLFRRMWSYFGIAIYFCDIFFLICAISADVVDDDGKKQVQRYH